MKLTQEQRRQLETLLTSGQAPARKLLHAHILLHSDQGPAGPRWSMRAIQEAIGVGESMVKRVRKRFVEQGLSEALERRQPPKRPEKQKLDGEQEARVIALLCGEPPDGQARWTLRLLADRAVALESVERVSHETLRTVLKRTQLKPWQKKQWCVAPTRESKYVYHMEDVLEVDVRPHDPRRPQVCLDEGSVQLVSAKREPQEMQPGQVKREDYEYEREGFCSLFLACEPLTGKTVTRVSQRRTKEDFAHFLQYLIDEVYPKAEQIVLVMDNLNTHTPAALSEVFKPGEAMRLWKKLEIHDTPLHGSWLNMAEIALSVLGRQVLSERIPDLSSLQGRIDAWQARREAHPVTINWRFTTQDARIKLAHFYPVPEPLEPDENGSNDV